jgi:hypothetical protein
MLERFIRIVRIMEIEEKVLHVGVLLCILGLFVPWIGVPQYTDVNTWNGFGFRTGYIGHVVLLVQLYILVIMVFPLFGGPIVVRKTIRNTVRLLLSGACLILLLSAFTILLRFTSEQSGAEIRFGIYVTIVGSALTTLYAFLQYQEQRKNEARQLFHHPDEQQPVKKQAPELFDDDRPPPPPPPAPLPPEDHQLFSNS